MRKYIRNMIRANGEYEGKKPSKWVRAVFEQLQLRKYGKDRRLFNQSKGTHKRKLWAQRYALFASK